VLPTPCKKNFGQILLDQAEGQKFGASFKLREHVPDFYIFNLILTAYQLKEIKRKITKNTISEQSAALVLPI
jgi:hypothetical protein